MMSEAWKKHVSNLRKFGPVKLGEAADVPRRYGAGRNPGSEATSEYLTRLRATVPVFKALLYTGSRLNEILSLRWESIDLKRGVLIVAQRKTKKPKVLPISESLRATLEALPAGIGKAYVFTRPDGEPFFDVEVQRAFGVAKKLARIRPELTPHSIRHTFASWLAIAGTPLRTIQELLGHADIRMTIKYAHLSPAHLADAVKTIDTLAKSDGSGTQVAPWHRNGH